MKIFTTLKVADCVGITADIVKDLPRDIDSPIFVFCESKATLSYETAIAKATGGTFNVEVTSFSRYLSKRVRLDRYLSKSQGALLVRKLMGERREQLFKIKPNAFNVPRDVYELISQLKAALVTPDDLERVLAEEGGAFGTKLKDIVTVYKAYEDFLKENAVTDEGGFLSLMPAVVAADEKLRGARVIVSGIQSFTRQTLEILKALSRVAAMDFVFSSGPYECFTNESVNKVSELFKYAEVVRLDRGHNREIAAISDGLFNPSAFTGQPMSTDCVEMGAYPDIKSECEAVAKKIRRAVVEEGFRYKDFSVLCPNMDVYGPVLEECFCVLDIKYFLDRSESLDKHGVNGLIGGLIDIKRLNLLPESLIETVKCGYFVSDEEGSAFEKYVKENALSRRTVKQPFDDLIAESVRGKILDVYQKLPRKGAVSEYVDIILQILSDLNFDERFDALTERLRSMGEGVLAEFNEGARKGLYTMLSDVKAVLGDAAVDLTELKNILSGAAATVEVSSIPQYYDNVFIGDYSAGRMNNSPVVFAVGLTADVPKYKQDVALLNDRDLVKMDGYRLIIEPKLEIVNLRERENIAASLMSFTKKLVLSYPMTDQGGRETVKSRIIDYFNAIFAVRRSEEDGREGDVQSDYLSKKASLIQLAKEGEAFRERRIPSLNGAAAFLECIDGEDKDLAIRTLTGGDDRLCIFNPNLSYSGQFSASAIERYFSCPYKVFAERTLSLKDPEMGEAKVNEIGTLLHEVLEKFVIAYNEGGGNISSEKVAGDLFDKELEKPEYARYLNKPQYVHIFALLKEEAVKACGNLFDEIGNSSFKPTGAEVAFNDWDGQYKSLVLNTDGGKIRLRGKIDRVDRYKDYFTIVDYKSGTVDTAADEAFYTGRKIQLYLYSNVLKREGLDLAGAYYYKLSDDFTSEETCRFNGKTLKSREIANALDNSFDKNGKSKAFGITLAKDGIKDTKSVTTAAGFEAYQKYSEKVAVSGANEMLKGLTVASPYEKACEYCKFGGLCGYDTETGDRNRKIDGVREETIINAAGEKEPAVNAAKEDDHGKL